MIIKLLIFGSLPVFALYFYFFNKGVKLLDAEERKRLAANGSKWTGAIVIALVGCFIYFDSFAARSFLAVAVLVFVFFGSRREHKRLERMGFNPLYISNLRKISYLSDIGVSLFLVAGLLAVRPI